jgi:hypothetical protein
VGVVLVNGGKWGERQVSCGLEDFNVLKLAEAMECLATTRMNMNYSGVHRLSPAFYRHRYRREELGPIHASLNVVPPFKGSR